MALSTQSTEKMKKSQRISTIERDYPDQWVVIEVSRENRYYQAIAGRLLAHSPDEDEITREAVRLREQHPDADLFTFYTGEPIPPGMIVIFGCG